MDTSLALHPGVLPTYTAPGGGVAVAPVRPAGRSSGVGPVPEPSSEGSTLAGGGYGRLRARQDDLNDLAQAIREGGAKVEMRKLFPPYPPEQEDRMAYLDQISGLRRQIEALMVPAAQGGGPGEGPDRRADALARDISQDSKRLLAALSSQQSISSNRPLLEGVAQIDPVQ